MFVIFYWCMSHLVWMCMPSEGRFRPPDENRMSQTIQSQVCLWAIASMIWGVVSFPLAALEVPSNRKIRMVGRRMLLAGVFHPPHRMWHRVMHSQIVERRRHPCHEKPHWRMDHCETDHQIVEMDHELEVFDAGRNYRQRWWGPTQTSSSMDISTINRNFSELSSLTKLCKLRWSLWIFR